MGDFAKPVGLSQADSGPDFIAQAACCRCGTDAAITLFDVVNTYNGAVLRGAASEFSDSNFRIRDGYRLEGAYGFCADCYSGVSSRRGPKAAPEVAAAWAWAITHHGVELADLPTRVNVNFDQGERFSEIVNRQAMDHNNPEAIPPSIWREDIWGCTYSDAMKAVA